MVAIGVCLRQYLAVAGTGESCRVFSSPSRGRMPGGQERGRERSDACCWMARKAGPSPWPFGPVPLPKREREEQVPATLYGFLARVSEFRLIKPRTPPGVMELLPRDQIAFQRMLDTIRLTFERFGFLPVETPVFELSEVLLTKTGGETERQVYFVQSTGALEKAGAGTPELALRFDLTVPLARYVAEH